MQVSLDIEVHSHRNIAALFATFHVYRDRLRLFFSGGVVVILRVVRSNARVVVGIEPTRNNTKYRFFLS